MSGTRSLIRHSSLIRHFNPFDSSRVTRQSLISNRWREREREWKKEEKYVGKEKKRKMRERLSLCGCPTTMVRRNATRLISSGKSHQGKLIVFNRRYNHPHDHKLLHCLSRGMSPSWCASCSFALLVMLPNCTGISS